MKRSQVFRKPIKDLVDQNDTDPLFSCYLKCDFWIPHHQKVQGANFQSHRMYNIIFKGIRSQNILARVKFGRGHTLKWGNFWLAVNPKPLEILISKFFLLPSSMVLTNCLKSNHTLHSGLQPSSNLTWNDPTVCVAWVASTQCWHPFVNFKASFLAL